MRKILLVLVAMLMVSGAALAQDATPEVFCGDLAEEDCAILTQSHEAMSDLSSVAFDLQADFTIAGVPELEGPAAFVLTGSGAVSGDAETFAAMAGSDMSAMQDPVEAIGMAVEALRAVAADLSFTLTFPPQMMEEVEDIPESITLELRFVDGLGYLNMEPLAPIFEASDSQAPVQGWLGLDIASFLEAIAENSPEMFQGMEMFGVDAGMYTQFSNPNQFSQYATVTRTDDGSGDTATFTTTFDFAGLVDDPEFQSMMQQQMEAQGEDISDEDFQRGMEAAQAMLENSMMTATSTIDLTTGYQTGATFSMTIDTAAMAAVAADEGEETPEATPVISINFTLTLSDFNDVAEITEPENATVLPFESLLGMGGMNNMPDAGANELEMTPTPTAGS